jgi:hypothetical protein
MGVQAHTKVMQEKAIKYGEAIVSSSLKRGECKMAYNSCYMVILGYGMDATSLSMAEFEDIQKHPVNAILPKMRINQKTARNVVFGMTKYRGLGLAHLAAVKGYGKLQYIMGHLKSEDTLGKLYRSLM